MTTLPQTLAEAEATLRMAYARELVRSIRDEKISWCGLRLSWFAKPDNRRAAMQFIKTAAMSAPLAMIDLVNAARCGFDLAYDVACELILEHKHRRNEMPPSLAAFDMELTDPRRHRQKQRGLKEADFLMRDIAITAIVADVCWKAMRVSIPVLRASG